jgi:multisubunit Na+/H+ antiporter MnhB subunit
MHIGAVTLVVSYIVMIVYALRTRGRRPFEHSLLLGLGAGMVTVLAAQMVFAWLFRS